MRRLWPTLALSLSLIAIAATPAVAQRSQPIASVTLEDCRDAVPTSASFYARARADAAPGTRQMWIRFRVLGREHAGFRPVKAPELAVWRKSKPGARRFHYLQTVQNLRPTAEYRVLVQFRWYGAGGVLLRTASRRSPICGALAG